MKLEAAGKYEWVYADPAMSNGYCITAVTGMPLEAIKPIFGVAPDDPGVPQDDAFGMGSYSSVSFRPQAGGVFVVEDNGYTGCREDTLAQLSRAGRAGSLYWSVNMDATHSFAENGALLCYCEPMDPVEYRRGEQPGLPEVLIPEMGPYSELDFVEDDWMALGLLMIERFTGLSFTQELFESTDLVHPT